MLDVLREDFAQLPGLLVMEPPEQPAPLAEPEDRDDEPSVDDLAEAHAALAESRGQHDSPAPAEPPRAEGEGVGPPDGTMPTSPEPPAQLGLF